jgi:DNA-binding LytR/AlgR family response regulator
MNEASRAKLTEFAPKDHHRDSSVATARPAPNDGHDLTAWPADLPLPTEISTERETAIVDSRPRLDSLPPKPIRIAIKSKGKILLISPADILAVEAEGNYVLLVRHSDSHLLRESISTMAEKLKPYHFVRIHRSVLVNSSCVEEIYPGNTGEYMLRVAGGKQYIVSRTYKANLRLLAQSWIGIDSFVED